jgi:hypothetical protein
MNLPCGGHAQRHRDGSGGGWLHPGTSHGCRLLLGDSGPHLRRMRQPSQCTVALQRETRTVHLPIPGWTQLALPDQAAVRPRAVAIYLALFPNTTSIGHTGTHQKFSQCPNRLFFQKKEAPKIFLMASKSPEEVPWGM